LTYPADEYPTSFYAEGVKAGIGTIVATLKGPGGGTIHVDFIRVIVGWVNLVAYRPQTEEYGKPFPRVEVPTKYELDPGVGIRRNGDDDDDDGGNPDENPAAYIPDYLDTGPVAGENDLIEVRLGTAPKGVENIKWVLTRHGDYINAYTNANHTGVLFDAEQFAIDVTTLMQGNNPTIWVEWAGPAEDTSTKLTLAMWDVSDPATHRTLTSDVLGFRPFMSIVVAFGGILNSPLEPEDGAFIIAERLYKGETAEHMGYDVHAYAWDEVVDGNMDTAPFKEVKSAVRDRDIKEIGIFGYSKGGGATYVLSQQLKVNPVTDPVPIKFTAYIDAIEQQPPLGEFPETDAPVDTELNVNYYQIISATRGDASNPNSVNVNVTGTSWGRELHHRSIDQSPIVIDRIINGFTGPGTDPTHPGLINKLDP
jgi:hypothetical protein